MLATPGRYPLGALRASLILFLFLALTLPLMPVQTLLVGLAPAAARRLPHWYHRQVCRLLGLRLTIDGALAKDRPVLVVANHTSWLDIVVLSAVAPVSFVAKSEVGRWPFVSWLARLQRSVFIDRTRRSAVGDARSEMAVRLAAGDALVLFAEGTSTDGNRVLPFMSALFGAALPPDGAVGDERAVIVQSLAIVYTRLHGLPLMRSDRPLVGWYGDMALGRHAWALLTAGPLDVSIRIGPPLPPGDRKSLSQRSESIVRADVVRGLRAILPGKPLELARPPLDWPQNRPGQPRLPGKVWT